MRPETITAIGDFTALTDSDTDYLAIDPGRCSGVDDAPLRTTVYPKAGTDGAFVFPPLDDAQILTLCGAAIINSAGEPDDYRDAVETLFQSLLSALNAMKAAPDALVHTDGSVDVRKHSAAEKSWEGAVCFFTFAVVVDG